MKSLFIFATFGLIISAQNTGIITFYNNLNNACQFEENMYPDFLKVAISGQNWNNSVACGSCLTINGKGSGIGTTPFVEFYNAIVINLCSECENHHYDLLMEGNGIWDMEYEIIPCNHQLPIQYRTVSNNPFYFKIQIINTVVPVYNLKVNGIECQKTFDNFWVLNKLLDYPLNVEFLLTDGSWYSSKVFQNDDGFKNF